jgi:hypothetical protein
MKRIVLAFVLLFVLVSVCEAAKVNWKRLDMETGVAATGDEIAIRYITGLPEIDSESMCYSYNIKFEFGDKELILKRRMIDQKKGRGLTDVEIARMKYAEIKDLLFGYDAIYAAQEGELPSAQPMICGNQKLVVVMQMWKSPVAIMMERGGKKISFVVTAPNRDALKLYRSLAGRANVKTKTPLAYKGIIKERKKLVPPPPDAER